MRSVSNVLLATRSEGKRRELVPYLSAYGVGVDTLSVLGIEETSDEAQLEVFDTFEANALAKARWFHTLCPDRVVFAEDSGLVVDALDGAPGVQSKRWAGAMSLGGDALDAANNAHLQAALARAAANGAPSRAAHYVCVAACVWAGGELLARGETHGHIATTARGGGGFGYDPYFVSTDLGHTFAEVTREEKARVSHRGRAFASLLQMLRSQGILHAGG